MESFGQVRENTGKDHSHPQNFAWSYSYVLPHHRFRDFLECVGTVLGLFGVGEGVDMMSPGEGVDMMSEPVTDLRIGQMGHGLGLHAFWGPTQLLPIRTHF